MSCAGLIGAQMTQSTLDQFHIDGVAQITQSTLSQFHIQQELTFINENNYLNLIEKNNINDFSSAQLDFLFLIACKLKNTNGALKILECREKRINFMFELPFSYKDKHNKTALNYACTNGLKSIAIKILNIQAKCKKHNMINFDVEKFSAVKIMKENKLLYIPPIPEFFNGMKSIKTCKNTIKETCDNTMEEVD